MWWHLCLNITYLITICYLRPLWKIVRPCLFCLVSCVWCLWFCFSKKCVIHHLSSPDHQLCPVTAQNFRDVLLGVTQLCLYIMIFVKFSLSRGFPILCVTVGYSQREIKRRRKWGVWETLWTWTSSGGCCGGILRQKFRFNLSAAQPTERGKDRRRFTKQTIVMSVEKTETHRKVVNIGKSGSHKCHMICNCSGLCTATGEQKQLVMLIFKCHCGKQRRMKTQK